MQVSVERGRKRAKGGGKEGKGPRAKKGNGKYKSKGKERSAQAQTDINNDLQDSAYQADETSQFSTDISCHDWLADSGTTSHICNNRESFIDFIPLTSSSITGIGNHSVKALGRGTVKLDFKVGEKSFPHLLHDVMYTPNATNNLLSISRLDDTGGSVDFSQGGCKLLDRNGRVIGIGRKVRRLYLLDARVRAGVPDQANVADEVGESWDSWHRRYGHLSISALQQLHAKHIVEGLTISDSSPPFTQCESCIQAKQHRQPYPHEAEDRSKTIGELTHSDLWGPARVESISRARYYISLTDDYTRRCTVMFLKSKDRAFECVKEYVTLIERKYGATPKIVRVDNGGEYTGTKAKKWCADRGIELQTTAPYSPSQNGVAERFDRTLLELARAMLFGKDLPSFLWAEAVRHAAYVRNRAPTRALDGKTPEEVWNGKQPDISHLREFGTAVWISLEGKGRSKLLPRSKKFVFVGFEDGPKAVRYFDATTRKIKVSRNFVFSEKEPAFTEIDGRRTTD